MNKYFLETPASYFESINNFNYEAKFITNLLDSEEFYKKLKIAYIDENEKGSKGVLLMIHGHPTWSYLWRHLIPFGIKNDYRVIAIDLPGFGRSDKPLKKDFYTFSNYRQLLLNFIDSLNLKKITIFSHEWGGTLGLTLPMDNVDKYKGMVVFII